MYHLYFLFWALTYWVKRWIIPVFKTHQNKICCNWLFCIIMPSNNHYLFNSVMRKRGYSPRTLPLNRPRHHPTMTSCLQDYKRKWTPNYRATTRLSNYKKTPVQFTWTSWLTFKSLSLWRNVHFRFSDEWHHFARE